MSGVAGEEDVVALEADDKKTKKVDAETYRALVRESAGRGEAAKTVPASNQMMAELAAQTKPKKQALIVADHRMDTQHARAVAPITKPPSMKHVAISVERGMSPITKPPPMHDEIDEPQRGTMTIALMATLAVAIVIAIALVLR